MLLMFGNHIKEQSDVDRLYDNLQYTNGVCKKTINVTYLSFGKNPISPGNDKDDEIRKIKQRISYVPNSSVHFSYKEKEYYISIGNECDMTKYSEGDNIKRYFQPLDLDEDGLCEVCSRLSKNHR